MKPLCKMIGTAGLTLALCSCASRKTSDFASRSPYNGMPPSGAPGRTAYDWPRTTVRDSTTNLTYEPKIDFWDGHQVVARAVVGIQSTGEFRTTFGVVTIQGTTLVNKTEGTVSLENIQILNGDFPSGHQHTQECLRLIRATFPQELQGLSLGRLESSFVYVPHQRAGTGQALLNTPPKIFFSAQPALLVYIDGPPVYRLVKGTELQRVINTRLLLLRDRRGQFYLHILDGYMRAPGLAGPWVVSVIPPKGALEAERQATTSGTSVDLMTGQTDSGTNSPPHLDQISAPVIYVSTVPAELIVFEGEPDFIPIADTRLLYVANTTANVFKFLSDQRTYVLLSGRWFRAPSLQGPWQFVPGNRLPPDFAEIPDGCPKENVKASVPGTPQATEALIANSIPESTKVPLNAQMQNPEIDGPSRLEPIAGTSLYYVANSGTPILRVNEHSWYACQSGVWFKSTSLDGPWTVAVSVPPVIYSIPASSPLHYLTYVQIYGAGAQEVYEGYTPGYFGTEVEDGVVVYGTGYYYPPWIGDDWYGWPCTWGFGWDPCWTPWDDWCFDFGFGWGCGFGRFGWWHCHPPHPWYGPARFGPHGGGIVAWRRTDTASTAANLYSRAGVTHLSEHDAALPTRYGRAYNSRTGGLAAGQRAVVRNVYTSAGGYASQSGEWGHLQDTRAGGLKQIATPSSSDWRGSRARAGYSRGGSYSHGYSHSGWARGGGHGALSGGGHGGGHGGSGGGGHGGGGGGHG